MHEADTSQPTLHSIELRCHVQQQIACHVDRVKADCGNLNSYQTRIVLIRDYTAALLSQHALGLSSVPIQCTEPKVFIQKPQAALIRRSRDVAGATVILQHDVKR